jgi:YD repeat-containing protein
MADAGRPTWRNGAGEVEAVLATDHRLLRYTRDQAGRIVGVFAIEGPFDRNRRTSRDFFSIDSSPDRESDAPSWPSGGRVAWCHSFVYDAAGNLENEIDCWGSVKAFKHGSNAAIELERGSALAGHVHRGEIQSGPRSISRYDGREFVDRLRVDPNPRWQLDVHGGPWTFVIETGGARAPARK